MLYEFSMLHSVIKLNLSLAFIFVQLNESSLLNGHVGLNGTLCRFYMTVQKRGEKSSFIGEHQIAGT